MKRAITVSVLAWLASAALGAALADAPKEHLVRVVTNLDTFHMRFEPKHLTVAPGDTVI